MNRVHVAYHGSAAGEASKLTQKLQAQGWQIFSSECGNEESGVLATALKTFEGPTLLLINDGLLHDINCQTGMLETFRAIQEREHTHVLLASSMRNGPGNVQARVLTSLDRVSDVIRYMNYWQNAYLLKRRELGATSTPESAAALAPVREVSQEIGEFLKLVRKQKPHSVYDLIDDDGTLLLKLLGTPPSPPVSGDVKTEDPIEETPSENEESTDSSPPPISEIIAGASASAGVVAASELIGEQPHTPEVDVPELPQKEETFENEKSQIAEDSGSSDLEEVPTEIEEETVELEAEPKEVADNADIEEEAPEPEPAMDLEEDSEEAEPTLAELAAEKHKNSRKVITKQLLALIEEDELNDAYAFAEESLKADPGNAQLRYYYAVALLRAEDDQYINVAIHELDKLTQSDYAAEALLCLGHISLERRDYGTARRNLEAAYQLNKKVDTELTYRLGALLQDEYYEDKKLAKKYLKKATKNSKFNKDDAWYRLAQIDLQKDKIQKAKEKLKASLHAGERHPFAAYDLANLYLKSDNISKAHKYFQKAIYANPELDTEGNQAAFSLLRPVEEPEGFEARSGKFLSPKPSNDAPKVGQLTVLITGASSGIGAATARVFAEHGHRLILTGRRVANLRTLGAELNRDFNVPVRLLSFDVTAFEETEQLLATLPPGWNEIDVLINNAGKAKGLDFIHEGRLEHWEEMIDTNVKGLLYMIRLVSPQMVKREQGHIINVCSTAGHEVYPKGAVYCATKHAVDAITQGARLDLHRFGIRVSQVSPAHVEETEFASVRFDGDTGKAEKVYEDFQPLRAKDVAKSIYYIAAQPEHVNVQDVLMLGTQQANSTTIDRSGR